MYYAMLFLQNEWGLFNVRSVRNKGYASLIAAQKAVEKSGHKGYVKKAGLNLPVWRN